MTGPDVRRQRQALGVTQRDLAAEIGRSAAWVRSVEARTDPLTHSVISRYLTALTQCRQANDAIRQSAGAELIEAGVRILAAGGAV